MLLHIARQIYPDIPAVFSNTGLEYSSIQRFVKTWDNVDIVVPKMRFDEVISTYGYPLIGKEVAEAIYYARRLRSQSLNVERERTPHNPRSPQRTLGQADNLIETSGARNRRTILQGRWGENPQTSEPNWGGEPTRTGKQTLWKRMEIGGGQARRRAEISGALTMDEQLNRSRRAGVANGARGIDDALLPMNRTRETESAFGINEPG